MGAAVAVVLVKERHLVEALESAGAIDAEHAVPPEAIPADTLGIGWRRLRQRAVVRESSPGSGRYYLDRDVWRGLRSTRHKVAIVLGLLILLGLVFGMFGSLSGMR